MISGRMRPKPSLKSIPSVPAITASTIDRPHDSRADVMLRTGWFALRRISDFFGFQELLFRLDFGFHQIQQFERVFVLQRAEVGPLSAFDADARNAAIPSLQKGFAFGLFIRQVEFRKQVLHRAGFQRLAQH